MSEYRLTHEELLVYPGLNGHVGACHLRVYEHPRDKPVCIIGSFDELVGTSIQNACEAVATAISERIGRTRFTLIEWWPHTGCEFAEVHLRRVRAKKLPFGRTIMVGEDGAVDLDVTRRVEVRFAEPDWWGCDEQRITALLGEDALREMNELAGEGGEYEPARVFGVTGRMRIAAVNRHNNERVSGLIAQLAERDVK
ncbi:MAG: hypothetical protein ACRDL8_00670 [Solirubrobacteraceae bacterium]